MLLECYFLQALFYRILRYWWDFKIGKSDKCSKKISMCNSYCKHDVLIDEAMFYAGDLYRWFKGREIIANLSVLCSSNVGTRIKVTEFDHSTTMIYNEQY